MKILETVRSDFLVLGLNPNPTNRFYPFNSRNITRLALLSYGLITMGIYLGYEANSFEEYTNCIFVICALFIAAVVFSIMIGRSGQFFEFFDELERNIDQSK